MFITPDEKSRHETALTVIGAAVALGILGDVLLRETPWGLNLGAWTIGLWMVIRIIIRRNAVEVGRESQWLLAIAPVFALFVAWRDSRTLKALDVIALVITISVAALSMRVVGIGRVSLTQCALGVASSGRQALFGSAELLVKDVRWRELHSTDRSRTVLSVCGGLLFSVPFILVFGFLLMRADPVYADLVTTTFGLSFDELIVHSLLAGLIAWTTGGMLRAILNQREPIKIRPRPRFLYVGILEIGTVLAVLDFLFLSFVVVQFRYLFGGTSQVEATTGLTYAEYARRGFFELVTVSALVLPLLLIADWLLRKEKPAHGRIFRGLAGLQILLLFVIMGSALQRMRIYQSQYGLTELRVYTTAFMLWLAVVFIWFAATVLRNRRERFAFGALISAVCALGVLHMINPDALITRTNLERALVTKNFDARYATSLSADAVPELIAAMNTLSDEQRKIIARNVLNKWPPSEHARWRAWSWSRSRAAAVVGERYAELSHAAAFEGPQEEEKESSNLNAKPQERDRTLRVKKENLNRE